MNYRILIMLISLLCFFPQLDANADSLDDAQKAYKEGDFQSASEKFLNAEIEEPDNLKHAYNRSVSQYQNKDYESAASGFAKAAKSEDPSLARNSQFNLGNTLAAKGDLKGAKEAYSNLLKQYPEDQATKDNLAWVDQMIKEMEKQKQNQQNQDQDKQDQQDQDQQNQDQQNQDQEKQDQQNQDQQNQDQEKQDQQNQNQENQDQSKQEEDQSKQDKEEQDQEKSSSAKEDQDQQEDQSSAQNQQSAEESPEDLDKAEAERLLRSLEDQERYYGKPPKMPPPDRRPTKDW
ncbi:MAG: hypothetical protein HRU09_07655 [Oligoflexales bacterium]|nr:hypothetical protein [Oligoflexales bacterium]